MDKPALHAGNIVSPVVPSDGDNLKDDARIVGIRMLDFELVLV